MDLKMTKIKAVMVSLALAVAATDMATAQTDGPSGVEISPAAYDFGDVDGGVRSLRGEFVLRNCGTDVLRITDVKPACPCTEVEWTDEAVEPGDSCKICFIYNREPYVESFLKEIRVVTSRGSEPTVLKFGGRFTESETSIRANYPYAHGVLGLESEPVAMGKVYEGENAIQVVRVANLSTDAIEVGISECPEGVSAEMMSGSIAPLETGFLRIKVEKAPLGWSEFEVVPTVDGESVEGIRVQLLTVPDFRNADEQRQREGPYPLLDSRRVVLQVSDGQANTKLKMQNLSDEEMTVYSAKIPNPRFSVDFPGRVAANATVFLTLSLDASGLEPGEYYEKLYLVTDSPAAPLTEIDVVYIIG